MTKEDKLELIKNLKYSRSIGVITDEDADEIINALKAQKFGKWMTETDELGDVWIVCLVCGENFCTSDFMYYPNYCPECGAKMGKEVKRE